MTSHFKKYYIRTNIIVLCILISASNFLMGQSEGDLRLPAPKRLIDKVEVFAGPNLSFNYGNKFIENYRGEYAGNNYVLNKRLLKPGYVFGVGVYHPLYNRMDLNVRIQVEQKGTRNELNNPLNPVNDDARKITKDNYTYNYFTINASPTFYIGHQNKCSISFGGYYSKIKNVRGASESYTTRDFQVEKGSFKGRYFYHLREDGGMDGFAWMPYLSSIEDYDWGLVASVSYRIPIKQHTMSIQLQDSYGLRNINKNNPYNLIERSHSVSLVIGYTLKLPS